MAPSAPANAPYDDVIVSIVDYVYDYKVTSEAAWIRAKACLIDALGAAMEGMKTSDELNRILGPVFPGTSITPNGFKLPGTNYQLDALKGAFDMGASIRYLDHNDAFPGAEWGHPSDNLGAILAITDILARNANASGYGTNANSHVPTVSDVLEGLVKAYEVQGCFQIRNAFNKVGLDHTILVKIGSTAVSCWLLKMPREQALSAVSHAWCDGHPLRAYRQFPNAGPRKGWAAGEACKQAVHLAFMARSGQPGLKSVITAPRWGFYDVYKVTPRPFDLPKPFGSWVVENVLYKVNTAEGHGMTAVEAALQIADTLKQRGLGPMDIDKIRIRTQQAAMIIIDKTGPLNNPADRDHCLRYMIAVVLLKGSQIDTHDYQDDSVWAKDPRIDELRSRMTMEEATELTEDYHNVDSRSLANGLTATLKDGSTLDEVLIYYPQGHVRREDTLELVHKKAERNLSMMFSAARVKKIMDLYYSENLEKTPVDQFIDLFTPDS